MCRSRGATICKHCRVQASCSSSCSGRGSLPRRLRQPDLGCRAASAEQLSQAQHWAAMGAQGRLRQREQLLFEHRARVAGWLVRARE